jgi:hypothetical protein
MDAIANDPKTGRVYVTSQGGYDIRTADYVCQTGVITLDGRTGRVLRSTPIGRGTLVSGFGSIAVDPPSDHVYAGVIGDIQVPVYWGSLARLGTDGRMQRQIPAARSVATIISNPPARRVYVMDQVWQGHQASLMFLDATTGRVVATLSGASHASLLSSRMVVDSTSNRLFLFPPNRVITLDGSTGRQLQSATLPAGDLSGADVDERTNLLFVSQTPGGGRIDLPHPGTLTEIDATSGKVIRVFSTHSSRLFTRGLIVDGPAGVVLTTNGTQTNIFDARSGMPRRIIQFPPGTLGSPATVDPGTGHVFAYGTRGISEIEPGSWRILRTIAAPPFGGKVLIPDDRADRMFALEAPGFRSDVRSICLRAGCR